MSRISIDVTDSEHKKLKAMAALRGRSIKDYVLECTLGTDHEESALRELEELLDSRRRTAEAGAISRRTPKAIFAEAIREKVK
jgi:hypothetical protein